MAPPVAEADQEDEVASDDPQTDGVSDVEASNPKGGRKPTKMGQKKKPPPTSTDLAKVESDSEESVPSAAVAPSPSRGRRIVPVHQSRITDRPPKVGEKDSSLKIKIELDLEVEVEIYARVKGDVTIGLL